MLEILVVDDEKDICWALEKGLADEGVHVTQAGRGEDALQAVAMRAVRGRRLFDLAIIDVKLPDKSGIEIARIFRQLAPKVPVVMISGYHYAEDQSIQEGLKKGEYQGFISKPFEMDNVVALLRHILREGDESPSAAHRGPARDPVEGQPERR